MFHRSENNRFQVREIQHMGIQNDGKRPQLCSNPEEKNALQSLKIRQNAMSRQESTLKKQMGWNLGKRLVTWNQKMERLLFQRIVWRVDFIVHIAFVVIHLWFFDIVTPTTINKEFILVDSRRQKELDFERIWIGIISHFFWSPVGETSNKHDLLTIVWPNKGNRIHWEEEMEQGTRTKDGKEEGGVGLLKKHEQVSDYCLNSPFVVESTGGGTMQRWRRRGTRRIKEGRKKERKRRSEDIGGNNRLSTHTNLNGNGNVNDNGNDKTKKKTTEQLLMFDWTLQRSKMQRIQNMIAIFKTRREGWEGKEREGRRKGWGKDESTTSCLVAMHAREEEERKRKKNNSRRWKNERWGGVP